MGASASSRSAAKSSWTRTTEFVRVQRRLVRTLQLALGLGRGKRGCPWKQDTVVHQLASRIQVAQASSKPSTNSLPKRIRRGCR